MPRDLKADKEICEKATPGPWKWITKGNTVQSRAVTTDTGECGIQKTICASISPKTADAQFIASAREGWPEAIERAMNAEAIMISQINAIGALSEENDIQRASIQQLSTQVVAYRDALQEIKNVMDKMGHLYVNKPSEFKFSNLWIGQGCKIGKLLVSPDPGEKYATVIEAAIRKVGADKNNVSFGEWTKSSDKLREAVEALEGGPPCSR